MVNLFIGLEYTLWFILILGIVVFIHEIGHYIFARLNGVHVETFSLGFGKELFGYNDKNGTRWKISLIPLGGYVKMCGDTDPTSRPDSEKLRELSDFDKQRTLHYKSLWRKATIVFAGPAFNFISAILIMTFLIYSHGKPMSEAIITSIMKDSAAEQAGMMIGDKILQIDKKEVRGFEDIRQNIALNVGHPINLVLKRGENTLSVDLTPRIQITKDVFGNEVELPIIGISSNHIVIKKFNLFESVIESINETYTISKGMLKALGQIITGDRSVKQLGGPVKIAQYSGQSAKYGVGSILWFIALISINLGLVNLFPIPMLDGGHLVYYAVEALTGKPVAERFQLAAMKISFTLLLGFMIIVTYNDILNLITHK